MHHSAFCERSARQGEAVAGIEREIEIEAERQFALRRRFPCQRQSECIEAHDSGQARSAAMLGSIISEHALPVASLRARPIG